MKWISSLFFVLFLAKIWKFEYAAAHPTIVPSGWRHMSRAGSEVIMPSWNRHPRSGSSNIPLVLASVNSLFRDVMVPFTSMLSVMRVGFPFRSTFPLMNMP